MARLEITSALMYNGMSDTEITLKMIDFCTLVNLLTYHLSEKQLRDENGPVIKFLNSTTYEFIYGFGHNHMWIKNYNNREENLITIYF